MALSEAAKESMLVRNVLNEIGIHLRLIAYVDFSSQRTC